MRIISMRLPLRTVSALNIREHWSKRAKRNKEHRSVARNSVAAHFRACGVFSFSACTVRLTRYGKRKLDDDNLRGAMKAIRDGIADALGIDDGDDRVKYEYDQAVGREYCVGVMISETLP